MASITDDYTVSALTGEDGIDGQDGADGTSVTITSKSVQYQASSSGTTIPTGTWSDSVPSVSNGKYLWTRVVVNYSDGNSTTSYSVGYKGTNGINGARGGTYRGASTSVPSSPVANDYYFNTSTGYIQTYSGSAWSNDTMAVTNFHVLEAINDLTKWCGDHAGDTTKPTRYDANKALVDTYIDKLLVGTAFINKLESKEINFREYVASSKKENLTLGDLMISMGKNPNASSDDLYNFIIQTFIGTTDSPSISEIWKKDFFTKRENNRNDIYLNGKLTSYFGINSFEDSFLGSEYVSHNIITPSNLGLASNNCAMAHNSTGFYIFMDNSSNILIYKSTDGYTFSLNKTQAMGSTTVIVYDAKCFDDNIYVSTSLGVYILNDSSSTVSLSVKTNLYKPYVMPIIDDKLFFSSSDTDQGKFAWLEKGSTTLKEKARGGVSQCGLSKFAEGIYMTKLSYPSMGGFSTDGNETIYFLTSDLDYLGEHDIQANFSYVPIRSENSDEIVDYAEYFHVEGASNGIIFAVAKGSSGGLTSYYIVVSYDAGRKWHKKLTPPNSYTMGFRFWSEGSLIVLQNSGVIYYSKNGGADWITVANYGNSKYLLGSPFTWEDDNNYYVGIPTTKSGNYFKFDFIRQGKAGRTSFIAQNQNSITARGGIYCKDDGTIGYSDVPKESITGSITVYRDCFINPVVATNLSSSGVTAYYIVFANGLKIQWGTVRDSSLTRGYYLTVNFPVSFSNTFYVVSVTPQKTANTSGDFSCVIGCSEITETSMYVGCYGLGQNDKINGLCWLAIGF